MLQNTPRSWHAGSALPASHDVADLRLLFGKTGWALDFTNCTEEVRGLKQVLRGWGLKSGPPSRLGQHRPRGHIKRTSRGWHWHELGAPKAREWDAKPPQSVMRVITDVHDAALYWYLAEHPELLCMHGAAVKIGRGLVCFPAKFRAGKSTLMACLAARGHKIYADDVLGLKGSTGVALGFLPRLRTPFAPTLTKTTRQFIEVHGGPSSHGWHYLDPGSRQMAKLEESCPVKAFVLLDRHDSGRAICTPARTADVLKLLIAENIIRQQPMTTIFESLHRLTLDCRRQTLNYSDPQDAARLLERKFGGAA